MEKFCYKCGALEEEKGPFIEGLCQDCFLAENPLLKIPEDLELKICQYCGAYYQENVPYEVEKDPPAEYMEAAKELVTSEIEVLQNGPTGLEYVNFEDSEDVQIGLDAEYLSSEEISVKVEVQASLSDSQEKPFSEKTEVKVKLTETTCEICHKKMSGYYEAVLQVRGEEDWSEEEMKGVFQALKAEFLKAHDRSRDEFISKIKKKHGGIDLYTSSSKLAEDLARFLKKKYGGKMDKSAELIGQTEDGEEKYRVTVVARLPF